MMAKKPIAEWISPTEFAKYRGVNLGTVKDWIDDGKLENCWKTSSNNRKKINWITADIAINNASALRENSTASNETGDQAYGPVNQVHNLTKARTVKTTMEARAAQLKFEQLSGELCKTSDVENIAKQMGRLTKESLLTLADRLAPVLTGITDLDEIHEILTLEINTALRNLSLDNFDFFEGESDVPS